MQFFKQVTMAFSILAVSSVFAGQVLKLPFTQVDRIDVSEAEKDAVDAKAHTLASVEIEEIDLKVTSSDLEETPEIGKTLLAVDKLVAYGRKLYALAAKGRPLLTTHFDSFSVLPKSKDPDATFTSLYSWSRPKAKTYRVTYRNLYRVAVAVFEFSLSFQYNGTDDGKSRYLTAVRVQPIAVDVAWLYELDAESELLSIANLGSDQEKRAGATLSVSHTVKSILKHSYSSVIFHVTADGDLKVIQ